MTLYSNALGRAVLIKKLDHLLEDLDIRHKIISGGIKGLITILREETEHMPEHRLKACQESLDYLETSLRRDFK